VTLAVISANTGPMQTSGPFQLRRNEMLWYVFVVIAAVVIITLAAVQLQPRDYRVDEWAGRKGKR